MLKIRAVLREWRERGFASAVRQAWAQIDKMGIVQFGVRGLIIPWRVRHLSGPEKIDYGPDELIVVSTMRNGALWLKSFLAHHRAMGIRHFVVLDNGSTDGTIELLAAEPDVTVLTTDAPYSAYENTMKRYMAKRFCAGRWCLFLDSDELFHYPFAAALPLPGLLRYLNANDYNAVITQMLDMFSDLPLAKVDSRPEDDIYQKYSWYDLSAIRRQSYRTPVPDPRMMMHFNGIRRSLFGTENGLTKVSLFRMDGHLKPFVRWHHTTGARVADVSAVLLHYPFVSSFLDKVAEAVASERYGWLTTDEYRGYAKALEESPELSMKLPTARQLTDIDELVEQGFLVVSDRYATHAHSGG